MARQPGHEARFPDICPRCGRDIVPGQRIKLRGSRPPIHIECASGGDDE